MEDIELSERSRLLPEQGEDGVHQRETEQNHFPTPHGASASVNERKQSAQEPSNAGKRWPCIPIRKRSKFDGPFDLLHSLAENDLQQLRTIPSDTIKKCRYGSERITPLIIASFACSQEVVKALLDRGVDVNDSDAAGRLPLLVAVARGSDDVVSELLEKGANPNLDDSGKIRESCAREDLEWYNHEDEYMKKHNLELPKWERNGRTALHFAVESNRLGCVKCLLEKKADAGAKDDSGVTPLLLAGEKVDPEDSTAVDAYEKIVNSLIEHGFDATVTHEPSGRSPLIKAAELGSNKCLSEFLRRGADPNWGEDKTALHCAIERASMSVDADPSCVSTLLSHGADLCAEDDKGVSALRAIFVEVTKPVVFFNRVLDDQVTLVDEGTKAEIRVNFRAMLPQGKICQENVLHSLMEDECITKWMSHKIFRHPYLMSFVQAKWKKLRFLFFLYISVYIIHVLSLSIFATLAHSDLFQVVDEEMKQYMMQDVMPWSRGVVIFTAFLVLMNTSVMCYVFRKRYAYTSEMFRVLFESMMSIISCFMTIFDGDLFNKSHAVRGDNLFPPSPSTVEDFPTVSETLPTLEAIAEPSIISILALHFTSIAIFLAWLELMLQVGRLPWASDALLFTAVLKNVLRALFTYGFMIVGFAFVFFLEFRFLEPQSFGDPFRSMAKTVVMMLGEFDYNGLFSGDKGGLVGNDTYVIGRIVFLCFVVLVPIALMNLMLGLAVSDTRDLDAESSERQLMKRAECVVHWEFVVSKLERMACSPSWMRNFRTIDEKYSFATSLNNHVFPVDIMKSLLLIASNNRKEGRSRKAKVIPSARGAPRYSAQPSQDSSRTYDLNQSFDAKDVMEHIRIITDDLKELKEGVAAIREIVEEQFRSDKKPQFQYPIKGAKWNPQKSSRHTSISRVVNVD